MSRSCWLRRMRHCGGPHRLLDIGWHAPRMREIWKWSRASAVVHAHDAKAHTLAALASRKTFVVSRRVAFPVKRTVASRWKYRRATRYLAVSEYVAGELRKAGVPAAKIDVVYDGVSAHS